MKEKSCRWKLRVFQTKLVDMLREKFSHRWAFSHTCFLVPAIASNLQKGAVAQPRGSWDRKATYSIIPWANVQIGFLSEKSERTEAFRGCKSILMEVAT